MGAVIIGRQYQDHNPNPGPVYAGGGYTPMTKALQSGAEAVTGILDKYPDLANEISTGGATPLHMCGMSVRNQLVTDLIIRRGGNIEAKDTYGYTPLHRMASNNLDIGALALLQAGADWNSTTSRGETALSIARESNARKCIDVIKNFIQEQSIKK
uniref:Ankyrin repeat domain-containing protein n=1 Tax=Fibrocapsa japonica TaxID=94617 RepID=A0A7S2UWI6_9STRA